MQYYHNYYSTITTTSTTKSAYILKWLLMTLKLFSKIKAFST